jgi:hypothetical protein
MHQWRHYALLRSQMSQIGTLLPHRPITLDSQMIWMLLMMQVKLFLVDSVVAAVALLMQKA